MTSQTKYKSYSPTKKASYTIYVIGFSAELDQFAAPSGEAIDKRCLEVIQQYRCQRFAAIFRH